MGALSIPGLDGVGPCAQRISSICCSTVLMWPTPWIENKGWPQSSTVALGTQALMLLGKKMHRIMCLPTDVPAHQTQWVHSCSKKNKGWWAFSFEVKKFMVAQPNWYKNCSTVSGYNIRSQWRIEPEKGVCSSLRQSSPMGPSPLRHRKLKCWSGVCGIF